MLKPIETRLARLCRFFGWDGGTIYQANRRASKVLGQSIDVLSMTEREYEMFWDYMIDKYPDYCRRELKVIK